MSTVHTEQDLQKIASALVESIRLMVRDEELLVEMDRYTDNEIAQAKMLVDSSIPMTNVQFSILKNCSYSDNINTSYIYGFTIKPNSEDAEDDVLLRFKELCEKNQVFYLGFHENTNNMNSWKYRKKILENRCFIQNATIDFNKHVRYHQSALTSEELYEKGDDVIFQEIETFSLYDKLFGLDVIAGKDGKKIFVFSFHHIAFDGYSVGKIRGILLSLNTNYVSSSLNGFEMLNLEQKKSGIKLEPVEEKKIIEYAVVGQQELDVDKDNYFLEHTTTYLEISLTRLREVQNNCSTNVNVSALIIFCQYLRAYFSQEKFTVVCTSSGRLSDDEVNSEIGMVARYFPCFLDSEEFISTEERGSAAISSYWTGFRTDFGNFLQKILNLKKAESNHVYNFSFNYENFEHSVLQEFDGTGITEFKSNSAVTSVFDISVNASIVEKTDDKEETLLFRMEYSPLTIDIDRFKNAV